MELLILKPSEALRQAAEMVHETTQQCSASFIGGCISISRIYSKFLVENPEIIYSWELSSDFYTSREKANYYFDLFTPDWVSDEEIEFRMHRAFYWFNQSGNGAEGRVMHRVVSLLMAADISESEGL